jgi:hypothetical protein
LLVTQKFISSSKDLIGVQVKSYQTFFDSGDTNNIHASIDTLMSLGSRVIFIASKDIEQITNVLTIAAHAGHINHETVWITMQDVKTNLLQEKVNQFNDIISLRRLLLTESRLIIPRHFKNAVEQVAWTTEDLEYCDYKSSFAGGIFSFVPVVDLPSYPPFDEFNQKWSNMTTYVTVVSTPFNSY